MKVLLATVSGSATLDSQLRRYRPDAVVAICCEEGARAVEDRKAAFPDLQWDSVRIEGSSCQGIPPHEDIALCAAAAREALAHARELLGEQGELIIDLAGGTKPMSLGLWMACPEDQPPRYAAQGFSQRLPDPRLPHLALDQAAQLVRSGHFCAAARLAEERHARFRFQESLDPHLPRRSATLRAVARALALWELGDFPGAAHALKFDPRRLLPPDAHPGLPASLDSLRRWLSYLRTPRLPYLDPQGRPLALDVAAFAHDCLLCARRLASHGAYDLALLKLYRAIEAALQAEFARLFEGRSNSNFPVRLLPGSCRAAWEAENQTANLGLERTLRVLEQLHSPLAQRFGALRADLPPWERAPISFQTQFFRNQGPWTHGFAPLAVADYQKCLEETEALLGDPEVEPPDWEELGDRLGAAGQT